MKAWMLLMAAAVGCDEGTGSDVRDEEELG
jgi:hypothetical protein